MKRIILVLVCLGAAAGGLYGAGMLPPRQAAPALKSAAGGPVDAAPAVSVVKVRTVDLEETVLITGTLVPRLEILVAPEVEGLRVLELLVEEADRVTKGQTIARLEGETLKVQLAQNDASLARAQAAIAQARSAIASAEARETEARHALERAVPLRKSGALSESTLDQREASAKSAEALLVSARDGLRLAEAEKALNEAQRRDIEWKLSKTEVRAPADGIISRRNARIGSVASANVMGTPMFSIIADGQIELEAEIPEIDLVRLKPGLSGSITLPGVEGKLGRVRMVSPEVDRATRQGKVRIELGADPRLRIGSFGRGTITTRYARGQAVPASAVLHGAGGTQVQIVVDGRIVSRRVEIGLQMGDLVEIRSGVGDGDVVVARAGTFLREGDAVTPVKLNHTGVKVN